MTESGGRKPASSIARGRRPAPCLVLGASARAEPLTTRRSRRCPRVCGGSDGGPSSSLAPRATRRARRRLRARRWFSPTAGGFRRSSIASALSASRPAGRCRARCHQPHRSASPDSSRACSRCRFPGATSLASVVSPLPAATVESPYRRLLGTHHSALRRARPLVFGLCGDRCSGRVPSGCRPSRPPARSASACHARRLVEAAPLPWRKSRSTAGRISSGCDGRGSSRALSCARDLFRLLYHVRSRTRPFVVARPRRCDDHADPVRRGRADGGIVNRYISRSASLDSSCDADPAARRRPEAAATVTCSARSERVQHPDSARSAERSGTAGALSPSSTCQGNRDPLGAARPRSPRASNLAARLTAAPSARRSPHHLPTDLSRSRRAALTHWTPTAACCRPPFLPVDRGVVCVHRRRPVIPDSGVPSSSPLL